MYMDLFKAVRERVTAREAAEYYGVAIRRNKARCIWHDDRRPSLSFKDGYCHCFACNNGGSAIDVAMQLYGMPAKAAADKLSVDFGLGLETGNGRHAIRPRAPTARDARDAVNKWYDSLWDESCGVVHGAQAILDSFTDPETAFDDPRFVSALRARSRADIILYELAGMSEFEKIAEYRERELKREI
jgi:DNA primase